MARILLLLFMLIGWSGSTLAQPEADVEIIEVKINPAFGPVELDQLIQLLAGNGVKLEFAETGYCNGQLRILTGKVTGPDGNSVQFETNALRQLTIQLRTQAKAVGVHGIRLKNRWRKCVPQNEEAVDEAPEMRRMHAL